MKQCSKLLWFFLESGFLLVIPDLFVCAMGILSLGRFIFLFNWILKPLNILSFCYLETQRHEYLSIYAVDAKKTSASK